jgi:biotin carboxyl carrier protein
MVDIVLDPLRWGLPDTDGDAVMESWEVDEGDRVQAGQVLGKASLVHGYVQLQAPHAGIVEQIAVSAGESFGPGYILARLVSF